MDHTITFIPNGRGKAQNPPDPNYPNGIHVKLDAQIHCLVYLPYPAEECGHYLIKCRDCGVSLAITAAGRPDDPISVTVPCKVETK